MWTHVDPNSRNEVQGRGVVFGLVHLGYIVLLVW